MALPLSPAKLKAKYSQVLPADKTHLENFADLSRGTETMAIGNVSMASLAENLAWS